ncbi:MAG TPA: histidine kinase dimerization/phospho-acceptor domain-containing protein [Gemmatimonadales bacterium]|nr:histidine kinase dimerization/phospho-acceptor domain-containing protein [Gemmatimonadales bacterium]
MRWNKTLFVIGLQEMSHRPPLPKRWALYCALAYLTPIVMLEALPEGEGFYKEISWLTTLAPAFILSLHFGMLGALAGLLAGTVLYVAVQLILSLHLLPVNQEILLPIYISYGALAIAVGWLSQQLHDFYQRLIRAERLAAIGEVAVTIRHEINNALAAIAGEAGLLKNSSGLREEDRAGVETILEMATRINNDVRKLTMLEDAPSAPYAGGMAQMVDLRSATAREA